MSKSIPESAAVMLGRFLSRFLSLLAAASFLCASAVAVDTVTVNSFVTHQTIEAWGAASGAFAFGKKDSLRQHLIDEVVNNLGLTQTRIEAQHGNSSDWTTWELLNDNGDSTALDWSKLNTNNFDHNVANWVVPMKQAVEANGETFTCCFSASFYDNGSTGTAPSWIINNPGEHAELLSSYLLRLRDVYGVTPTYCTILNEPGYHNGWNVTTLAKMIKTVGPRLQALGLPTKIQFPESVKPSDAWSAISTLQNDDEVWQYVGMLSYHLYGTPYDPYRANMRDFGVSKNIPRAQTEFTSQTVNILYDDLTLAEVSVWDLYYWGTTYMTLDQTWFSRKAQYWNVRQITKYVRPGAVRVDAVCSSTNVRPLAFTNNGKTTVVLLNNSGGGATTVDVAGVTPGEYAVSRTNYSTGGYTEVGAMTAGTNGVLSGVSLPSNGILTIYPHSGNLAPVVVDWKSSAEYLTLPASTTTLSASAQDPEKDAISYAWSVVSKPAGASVALATPNAASCAVSGMTVAGDYVFAVGISDATHTVTRTVEVSAYLDNQAPVINSPCNREPVTLILPSGTTTKLSGGATDLEGDTLTYQWSLVSAPSGATVIFETPTTGDCIVDGLTVAGNYVFEFAVSDPTHTVKTQLTVPVYPVNVAPVVSTVTASPGVITLPVAQTALSAVTSDPDPMSISAFRPEGDVLTHWWEVQSAPSGAKPVFGTPGAITTTVSGLTVSGTYAFKVSAMDRSAITSKTVSVTVNPSHGNLEFSGTAFSISEGNSGTSAAPITVSRTGGSAGAVSVVYNTGSGTARPGVDYVATSGTLTWIDGDAADKTFTAQVIGNTLYEADKTVPLSLGNATGGAGLGARSSAVLTILNDDLKPFEQWTASYGLTGASALEGAKPAGDGIPNLLKYALGLSPLRASVAVTDGVFPGLPAIIFDGTSLTMTYQKDTSKSELTYLSESSTDLVHWTTAGVVEDIQSVNGPIKTIKATVPVGPGARKFMRLNVSR